MSKQRTALLVLGMHRSGTSALTRVLNFLGADLPSTVAGASRHNLSGHWESSAAIALNDRFYRSLDRSWYSIRELPPDWRKQLQQQDAAARVRESLEAEFGDTQLCVLKDPRIVRFAPLWQQALRELDIEPKFILPLRNPADVAASLYERNRLNPTYGMLLWQRYVLEAEAYTRGQSRVITSYEGLLSDWRGSTESLGTVLDLHWPRDHGAAADAIEQFIAPDLRHHRAEPRAERSDDARRAQHVYQLLLAGVGTDGSDLDTSALDEARHALNQLAGDVGELLEQAHHEVVEVAAIKSELRDYQDEMSGLYKAMRRAHRRQEASTAGMAPPITETADIGIASHEVSMAAMLKLGRLTHTHPGLRSNSDLPGGSGAARHFSVSRIRRRMRDWTQARCWHQAPWVLSDWRLVTGSGLFHRGYYGGQLLAHGLDGDATAMHWLLVGNARGLSPHPLFDSAYYRQQLPSAVSEPPNLPVHYLRAGHRLGLNPNAWFDTDYYLRDNPLPTRSRGVALVDFIQRGAALGIDPHPGFDGDWYADRYLSEGTICDTALEHFIRFGLQQGFSPHPQSAQTTTGEY